MAKTQKAKPALVLVDMQPAFHFQYFKAEVRSSINQINRARRNNWPIYVLEYSGCGKTIKPIKEALKDYKLAHFTRKEINDGAHRVVAVQKRYKLPGISEVTICGINLGACVADTVYGLFQRSRFSGSLTYDSWAGVELPDLSRVIVHLPACANSVDYFDCSSVVENLSNSLHSSDVETLMRRGLLRVPFKHRYDEYYLRWKRVLA